MCSETIHSNMLSNMGNDNNRYSDRGMSRFMVCKC